MTALSILCEDDRLIAVAKSSGQLVIPGRGVPGPTLQQQLQHHLGFKPLVVHRLDREASGVVLFAKDPATHRALCAAFETRTIHKLYLALVEGRADQDGIVDRPIRQYGSGRMGVGETGKPSRTRYHVRKRFGNSTLLEVEPETGRRHQIRVHLYSIGHPILGDPLYGEHRPVGGAQRLMLHALELCFELEGRRRVIRCEPPADFQIGLDPVR